MANEKEEHYEEDGEYHFSDDQVNYDMEPEPSKTPSTSPFTKEGLLGKFNQHRRGILGAVSLIVLIGVVYKILIPSSTPPVTEFSQAPTVTKPVKTIAKAKSTTVSAPVTAPAVLLKEGQPAVVENKPTASPVIQRNPVPAPSSSPPSPAPAVVTVPVPAIPQADTITQPVVNTLPPSSNVQTSHGSLPAPSVAMPIQAAVPVVDAQTKDRVVALEQQMTAMMNLLQTEYAQKIADGETHTNAMRGKMEELTKRINHLEATLNQLTQLLQGVTRPQPASVMGNIPASITGPAARSVEPKIMYSVQAIIPGRAWLKSEAGDTVTVAEGDYLKNYGHVTKIDPYDGIVAIDTGRKVINLSYGVEGD